MGVTGLLKALRPITRPVHISQFAGEYIAVDASCWLHRSAHTCASQLALEHASCDKYLTFLYQFIQCLIMNRLRPVFVFDGQALPAKAQTSATRSTARQTAYARGLALHAAQDYNAAETQFQRSVQITPEMTRNLQRMLYLMRLPFVVAPYEADAQIAKLCGVGDVDDEDKDQNAVVDNDNNASAINDSASATPVKPVTVRNAFTQIGADAYSYVPLPTAHCTAAITEDSDLMCWGVKRLLLKLQSNGECQFLDLTQLQAPSVDTNDNNNSKSRSASETTASKTVEPVVDLFQFPQDEFCRQFAACLHNRPRSLLSLVAVLSGCDYLPSMRNFGLKTATRLIAQYRSLHLVMRHMRRHSNKTKRLAATQEYEFAAHEALLTFRHQVVFAHAEQRFVYLHPLDAELHHLVNSISAAAASESSNDAQSQVIASKSSLDETSAKLEDENVSRAQSQQQQDDKMKRNLPKLRPSSRQQANEDNKENQLDSVESDNDSEAENSSSTNDSSKQSECASATCTDDESEPVIMDATQQIAESHRRLCQQMTSLEFVGSLLTDEQMKNDPKFASNYARGLIDPATMQRWPAGFKYTVIPELQDRHAAALASASSASTAVSKVTFSSSGVKSLSAASSSSKSHTKLNMIESLRNQPTMDFFAKSGNKSNNKSNSNNLTSLKQEASAAQRQRSQTLAFFTSSESTSPNRKTMTTTVDSQTTASVSQARIASLRASDQDMFMREYGGSSAASSAVSQQNAAQPQTPPQQQQQSTSPAAAGTAQQSLLFRSTTVAMQQQTTFSNDLNQFSSSSNTSVASYAAAVSASFVAAATQSESHNADSIRLDCDDDHEHTQLQSNSQPASRRSTPPKRGSIESFIVSQSNNNSPLNSNSASAAIGTKRSRDSSAVSSTQNTTSKKRNSTGSSSTVNSSSSAKSKSKSKSSSTKSKSTKSKSNKSNNNKSQTTLSFKPKVVDNSIANCDASSSVIEID